MTAATEGTETRINAFHDGAGQCFGIIEYAGWDCEKHTGALFKSSRDAWAYVSKHYDDDEVESLGVDVGRWDREGEFWTYD